MNVLQLRLETAIEEAGEFLDVRLSKKDAKQILELLKEQEAKRDYEASVEMAEYCERYEQTYNPEDGSM